MQHRAERIRQALHARFPEAAVSVVDESHRHAGHAGARPEGETHFHVAVVAAAFAGQARLARSRAVHATLAAELANGLHALSLSLLTPEEAASGSASASRP
jgi:BolA family transcriptional regulator, general stress-responsive regulator